jgi:DDE superfamily endonuclease
LREALDTVLVPAKEAFPDALFSRVRAHLYSQLLCMGRHTITGLLSTQGRVHQDWSADYRLYANRRLDPEVLFGCVRGELRARRKERDPLVLALDDSLLRKRGPRTHGVKWLRDPLGPPFSLNFVRGQRVVQFSAALQNGPGAGADGAGGFPARSRATQGARRGWPPGAHRH